jgi:hypothetical protein
MLGWATHAGQHFNNGLAYARVLARQHLALRRQHLAPELTTRSEEFIHEMTDQGMPIFPGPLSI